MAESVDLEIVKVDGHPQHGDFEVEVPKTYSDEDIRKYVKGLDLDLMLGLPQEKAAEVAQPDGETDLNMIKDFENKTNTGLRDGKWFIHDVSASETSIAYGHKLTENELTSGIININGKDVNCKDGLTKQQGLDLLQQDSNWAREIALASLVKADMHQDSAKVQALTSLIYNVGSGNWAESDAKKALESGNIEDFMHEAFDSNEGFVKANGKVSRGLVRRRADEARLFGANTEGESASYIDMIGDVLSKLSPISTAQATEVTPQTPLDSKPTTEMTQLPTLKRNAKDTESVGTLQDMLGMDVGEDRGIFGPATEKAVKAFQKEQGLTADGVVGKNTWDALQSPKLKSTSRQVKDGANVSDTSDFFSFSLFSEAQAAAPDPLKQNEVPTPKDILNTAKATNIVRHASKTLGIDERNPEDQAAVKGFIDNAIGKTDALGADPAVVATEKAWCTAWLYHVLTSAGLERTKLANQMNSSDPYDFVRAAKYKEVGEPVWKKGEDTNSIKAGDIMIKMHTKEDIENPANGLQGRRVGFAGHVGIVTKIEGDNVYFISGNSGGNQVKESSYSLIDKDITIRRATGIKNVPDEIVTEVVAEEEWGSLVGGITRLFNSKSFEDEAIQMFKETGLPSLAKKAKKKISDVFD